MSFDLVQVAADLMSNWMKMDWGVFSNIEQITVWFLSAMISPLYISLHKRKIGLELLVLRLTMALALVTMVMTIVITWDYLLLSCLGDRCVIVAEYRGLNNTICRNGYLHYSCRTHIDLSSAPHWHRHALCRECRVYNMIRAFRNLDPSLVLGWDNLHKIFPGHLLHFFLLNREFLWIDVKQSHQGKI